MTVVMPMLLPASAIRRPKHDGCPGDWCGPQLVEVAALDVLDQVQGGGAEGGGQQDRAGQLEGGVVLPLEEVGRPGGEDPGRLAHVHDQEEQRDEEGSAPARRGSAASPGTARWPSSQGLGHASTPAPRRRRVRGCDRSASRKTSSSVGSCVRPRRSFRSSFNWSGVPSSHDEAAVDDRQAVAELVGLFEVLRREEDRRALAVDPPHLLPDGEPAGRVEAGRWLVEEEDLGPVHEGRGQVEPALHAPRVALDAAVGGLHEVDQLEELLGPLRRLGSSCRTAGPAARAAHGRSGGGRAPLPGARRRWPGGPRRDRRPRRSRRRGPSRR